MSHFNQRDPAPDSEKATQILDAAKRLFIDNGFGATSMDAIAAGAGVSKATVYAYHANKKTLFAAMTRRECASVTAQMAIPSDVEGMQPAAALERIARSFLRIGLSSEIMALLRMVIAETRRFPELGAIFYESAPGVTLQGVVGYMRRARAHRLLAIDDCELAAAQFLGMLRGDLHLRALLGQSVDHAMFERAAGQAVHTFMACYARRMR